MNLGFGGIGQGLYLSRGAVNWWMSSGLRLMGCWLETLLPDFQISAF